MRSVIVYESMFGNTHAIAEAIAEGLRPSGQVTVVPVGDVQPELIASADLVVVGGPTHVRGMSRDRTREGARERTLVRNARVHLDPGAVEPGPGIREWLDALPESTERRAAAAFDTRVNMPSLISGRASQGIANGLRLRGFRVIVDPESFLVDKESMLVAGEQERALQWARRLAAELAPVG